MVDTVILLGNFQFRDHEIPELINFGGEQKLAVKELVGGTRIIDAMGPSHGDPTWSGLITGSDAMQRASLLDAMRIAGQALDFSVFSLRYKVLIASFIYKPEKYYQVRYDITLKVIIDYNAININNNVVNFTGQVNNDLNSVKTLTSSINDVTLTTKIDNLSDVIDNTTSIEQADPQTVNQINDSATEGNQAIDNVLTNIHDSVFGSS